jgi:hypothetical protein
MSFNNREIQLLEHMRKCARRNSRVRPHNAVLQAKIGGHSASVFKDIPMDRVYVVRTYFWIEFRKRTYRKCFMLPSTECRAMLIECRKLDDILLRGAQ